MTIDVIIKLEEDDLELGLMPFLQKQEIDKEIFPSLNKRCHWKHYCQATLERGFNILINK